MATFAEKLARGQLVFTSELPTIDGGGLERVRTLLDPVSDWADAVNATDNAAAHAHASNVAIAIAIRQLGVEPIMQVVCRDKNRLAIEADIAGAALHGVENICCLTGDDVTAGDEAEARRVFDLDGPQLVRVATTMARGSYLSGRKLEPAPSLFVGAVENPAAPPVDYRAERLLKKIRAGARFFQLQICYHEDRLEGFLRTAVENGAAHRAAILPTICIVSGVRPLDFMHESVPGIDIPAAIRDRVRNAADPRAEAFALAVEQARTALALPGVAGLHVCSFRGPAAIPQLLQELGIPSREERDATHAHRPAISHA